MTRYAIRYPDGTWTPASVDCADEVLRIMHNPADADYRYVEGAAVAKIESAGTKIHHNLPGNGADILLLIISAVFVVGNVIGRLKS